MTGKTLIGAYARAKACVERNVAGRTDEIPLDDIIAWVTGAVIRYACDKPEPTGVKKPVDCDPTIRPGNIHESGPTALGGPPAVLREHAKASGFTGDACNQCGNFTLQRNGTCTVCRTCGHTSGCS